MPKTKDSREQAKDTGPAGKRQTSQDRTKQVGRSPDLVRFLQRYVGNSRLQSIQADQGLRLARSGEGGGDVAPEVEQAIQQARGGGQPLDSGTRVQMEPAFGADFGGVRVHADAESDALSRGLNARAFTTGQDIFFRQGAYDPGSANGRELLAHELTHVVQQEGDEVRHKLTVNAPGDRYEQEADRMARVIVGQERRPVRREAGNEREEAIQARESDQPVQRESEGEAAGSSTWERRLEDIDLGLGDLDRKIKELERRIIEAKGRMELPRPEDLDELARLKRLKDLRDKVRAFDPDKPGKTFEEVNEDIIDILDDCEELQLRGDDEATYEATAAMARKLIPGIVRAAEDFRRAKNVENALTLVKALARYQYLTDDDLEQDLLNEAVLLLEGQQGRKPGTTVQRKLTVNAPGDRYEQEADRVARAIMQQEQPATPIEADQGLIHRQVEKEEEEPLQAKAEYPLIHRQVEEEKQLEVKESCKQYGIAVYMVDDGKQCKVQVVYETGVGGTVENMMFAYVGGLDRAWTSISDSETGRLDTIENVQQDALGAVWGARAALEEKRQQPSGGLQVDPEEWDRLQNKLDEIQSHIKACFSGRAKEWTKRATLQSAELEHYEDGMNQGEFRLVDFFEDICESVVRYKRVSPPKPPTAQLEKPPTAQPTPPTAPSVIEIPDFETNSDTLPTTTPRPFRDFIAPAFPDKQDIVIESITGYADRRGSFEHNLDLSERRAESVRIALGDAGFDVSKVKPIGKSWLEAKKRASRGERAKERKVVIVWRWK